MTKEEIFEKLKSVCECVRQDVSMAEITTFRTGGPADFLAEPASVEEAERLTETCRELDLPLTVIGRASNLLVRDGGIRGVVLRVGRKLSKVVLADNRITAEAGATLSSVYSCAYAGGIGGYECLAGIPGSVGGAVRMNAGAYGGEIRDVILGCTYLEDGAVHRVTRDEMELGYRHSIFSGRSRAVILSAEFDGSRETPREEIFAKYSELMAKRREKQPLELPSAGSTFKRPEGNYASKLIDEAGLKGYRCGGAAVSDKHAGFVVNLGGATSEDILQVIRHVQKTVKEKFGVDLETEVEILGE